jgi:3-methyladenine DNA glycosylase AlkD
MLATESRAGVLALAHRLIKARIPRFVAYELVLNHKTTMKTLTRAEVQRLGDGISHWGDIDSFACIVSGPAWRIGRIRDGLIRRWAQSGDWCWRRAALVSTVPLNSKARGGQGDARRTLGICKILVADGHGMVEKALSWALRELAQRDSGSVEAFLAEHVTEIGARVKREVKNKLTTGLESAQTSEDASRSEIARERRRSVYRLLPDGSAPKTIHSPRVASIACPYSGWLCRDTARRQEREDGRHNK